jgi:hypothetical protein
MGTLSKLFFAMPCVSKTIRKKALEKYSELSGFVILLLLVPIILLLVSVPLGFAYLLSCFLFIFHLFILSCYILKERSN